MKARTYIAAIALTLAAGTATAGISTGSIGTDVQSAIGSGHASVILKDGVATLTGVVESQVDKNAAVAAAANFEGVDRVISNIFVSN